MIRILLAIAALMIVMFALATRTFTNRPVPLWRC